MASAKMQLKSLNSDRDKIFAVGAAHFDGALHIPQTPTTYLTRGGPLRRSPRIITIDKNPSTIYRLDLEAAPPSVKSQLASLIDNGEIEIVDDPGPTGANAVMSGDDIRAL